MTRAFDSYCKQLGFAASQESSPASVFASSVSGPTSACLNLDVAIIVPSGVPFTVSAARTAVRPSRRPCRDREEASLVRSARRGASRVGRACQAPHPAPSRTPLLPVKQRSAHCTASWTRDARPWAHDMNARPAEHGKGESAGIATTHSALEPLGNPGREGYGILDRWPDL